MGQAPRDELKAVGAVEREVDELRERTTALLEELERRVRDGVDKARGAVERVKGAVDVRKQLARIPPAIKAQPVLAEQLPQHLHHGFVLRFHGSLPRFPSN